MLYGAPILSGAITLLSGIRYVQVMGAPACGLYYPITTYELLLSRLLANQAFSRENLAAYGHGEILFWMQDQHVPQMLFRKIEMPGVTALQRAVFRAVLFSAESCCQKLFPSGLSMFF